ncbi:MAG TPA: methyltransferase domain-containing protein, partial [Thermoanaerobaculia bacterium]|nr:methyltransferase domain-containing protein [Thermoanaerobaculia bacterium]
MCPVCGSQRHEARAIAGVAIRRCRDCGMRTATFGERKRTNYADVDPRAYLQAIARVRRAQGEEIVSFVREHVAGGEWLDVGCGFGFVLEAARAAGFAIRGLEPDAHAAGAARERLGDAIARGTLVDGTPAADVVSTLDVIEHLDDVNAFAQLVRRKARALWVIKVPSSEGLFFRAAHALRLRGVVRRLWQADYEHPHTLYFDRTTLTRFLARHGFAVVAARYLAEVPLGTAVDRLTLDGGMPRWRARLALPAVLAVNVLERLRGKSDSLLVVARPM